MTTAEKASDAKECGFCKCIIYRGNRDSHRWGNVRYCGNRCSAFYRGVLIGGWRNDKKECIICRVPFGPRPDMPKGEWQRIKCCSKSCARKAQTGRKPVLERRQPKYRFQQIRMKPEECRTAGQRLRFLRLSKSPEGTKQPIGTDAMTRIAKIGHSTIAKIESDDQTVPAKCIEKLCAALKIPVDMLRWTDKKWARVVTKIGLTATEFRKTEPKPNESN